MNTIENLPMLYKRDSKGKIRVWQVEIGYDSEDVAGTRSVAGLQDGQRVTSEWNISTPKNVGKINGTTGLTQAKAEAKATWDKRSEKEYFESIADIDAYDKFSPMLAGDYTKKPQSEGYSQPKLDGIRCVANSNGLWTRSGKPITSCPHVWSEVQDFLTRNPNVTLDGELYNHDLKEDFNKIVSLVRKTKTTDSDVQESAKLVQYHVYDMYDENVPTLSFVNRTEVLERMSSDWQSLRLVPTTWSATQDELDENYGQYMTDGYEGQMVRNDAPYEKNKRSKALLKRKEFITEEFPVVAMLEGQGNWSGHTKRFTLRMPDGTEIGSGVRGNQEQLRTLWESKETPTWVTLRYFGLTPDGVPRFPVVIDYGIGDRID